MKIKGFLKDVTGASRVTKARLSAFESASAVPEKNDPIADVVAQWHPKKFDVKIVDIRDASPTAKTVRFVRADGQKLPFFYAGQFVVLDFKIGNSIISRPYSISSAPFEARAENGFAEIYVVKINGQEIVPTGTYASHNGVYLDAKGPEDEAYFRLYELKELLPDFTGLESVTVSGYVRLDQSAYNSPEKAFDGITIEAVK